MLKQAPALPRIETESVAHLWGLIRNGTTFTFDQIQEMLAVNEQDQQGFYITQKDTRYHLPQGAIMNFFVDHPRPIRKLSPSEENQVLKKEIDELKKQLELVHGKKVMVDRDVEEEREVVADKVSSDRNDDIESVAEVQQRLAQELKNINPQRLVVPARQETADENSVL